MKKWYITHSFPIKLVKLQYCGLHCNYQKLVRGEAYIGTNLWMLQSMATLRFIEISSAVRKSLIYCDWIMLNPGSIRNSFCSWPNLSTNLVRSEQNDPTVKTTLTDLAEHVNFLLSIHYAVGVANLLLNNHINTLCLDAIKG